ncbi:50S ribosomal protein L15 [Isoptericola sp. b441]|uniref:Large ribosomal subunit protein uL15 n=1 Tax=Actinotalea lenta TaxID=3064654 RepID=A0ABT9D4V9_9CELL|nr:50S ribosomal protein L15 [Isoptericola sp. b441]MDO8105708.1 50S ribosomal protein L15 [Isoptericola sp. b441]
MADKDEAAQAAEEQTPEKKAPARRSTAKAAADKPATTEKPAAKKPAAKKPAARKAAADEPAAPKAAGDEPVAEAAAKKPATKKPAAKASASKASEPAAESGIGMLKVHHLRPAPGSHTAKTRVGRGEASKGKTAGRGTKGTKARYQVPERFEGGQMPMHMRLPKLRGFTNPFRVEYQVVNLDKLATLYPEGGEVTVADLVAKGAVRKGAPVKVLGTGDVNVKLSVAVQKVSASAAQKIVAAGGSVEQA